MSEQRCQPGLHRIAMLTVAATFPLIFMGGLVTSHQAGMSVPDWPNSYGYNMFLFPPNQWVGGIFYEHTHRLMGTVVGFCSILLVLFAWGAARNPAARRRLGASAVAALALSGLCAAGPFTYNNNESLTATLQHSAVGFFSLFLILGSAFLARTRDDRRWVRWLAVGVLTAVIFQGILGGLRVILIEIDLAIVHACFAQAFFCLTVLMAAVTSRWWVERDADRDSACLAPASSRRALLAWATLAVLTIYAQLVAGSVMRHYDAGLAIPDLPLVYGQVIPPTTAEGLAEVNQWRIFHPELSLDRVTLEQIWIHFAHRVGAIAVTAAVLGLVIHVFRRHRGEALLLRPAAFLLMLLLAQLTLGVLTVLQRKPADVASAHVAVGALTLVAAFLIGVRATRLVPRGDQRHQAFAGRAAPSPRTAPIGGAVIT